MRTRSSTRVEEKKPEGLSGTTEKNDRAGIATPASKKVIEETVKKAVASAMAGEVVSGLVKGLSAAVRDVIESSVRREVAAAFKMAIPQLHTSSGAAMSPPPSNGRASGAYQVEYRQVTQKDWDEVKAAMPGIHWRQCPNKHWYAVGECGNPIATGYCIECKTTLR